MNYSNNSSRPFFFLSLLNSLKQHLNQFGGVPGPTDHKMIHASDWPGKMHCSFVSQIETIYTILCSHIQI